MPTPRTARILRLTTDKYKNREGSERMLGLF